MKPSPIRHIVAGAATGALVVSATTLVMVFQPGIVEETVDTRDVLQFNLAVGLPICVVAGALLGWLWHRILHRR